jgi:hypothetical protein
MKGFVQNIEDITVRNEEFRRVLYTPSTLPVKNGHSFTLPAAA